MDPELLARLQNPVQPYSRTESGLLLHEGRVVVPDFRDLRLRVLKERHDHPISGHFGLSKTLENVRRNYFWPELRDFVSDFCRSCTNCAKPE